MKKDLKTILICLIAFTLLTGAVSLTGCNSSDNDGDSNESISGNVADGYLNKATVCLDINENKACDGNEPQAISEGQGNYTIDNVSSEQKQKYSVVVEVTSQTTDEDTGEAVENAYTMEGIPGDHDFVSPMTTMVKHQMDENPALDASSAETKVKNQMGEDTDLTENYIKKENEGNPTAKDIHGVAQAITRAMGEIESSMKNKLGINLDTQNKAAVQAAIMDAVSNNLDKVANKIQSTNNATEAAKEVTQNTELNKNASIAEDYINQKKEQIAENKNATISKAKEVIVNNVWGNLDSDEENGVGVDINNWSNGAEYYNIFFDLSEIAYDIDNADVIQSKYKHANYSTDDNGKLVLNGTYENGIINNVAINNIQGEDLAIKEFIQEHENLKQDLGNESNLVNETVSFDKGAKLYELSVVRKKPSDLSGLDFGSDGSTLYEGQEVVRPATLENFVESGSTFHYHDNSKQGYTFNSTDQSVRSEENADIKVGSYKIEKIGNEKTLLVELYKEQWDMAARIIEKDRGLRVVNVDVMLTENPETLTALNKEALQDVVNRLKELGY